MDLGECWQEKHEETLKGTRNSGNTNSLYGSVLSVQKVRKFTVVFFLT